MTDPIRAAVGHALAQMGDRWDAMPDDGPATYGPLLADALLSVLDRCDSWASMQGDMLVADVAHVIREQIAEKLGVAR